ncbi:MAG: type IV secretory system conjugative DNA transfer family protein [Clostridia bacterium]|nr:type IV secretory system conjugative DNA transfer family protein [Clostridia bacterium]
MDKIYGKEGTQNILDNGTLLYLKTNNIDTATKISDKLRNLYSTSIFGKFKYKYKK